MEELEAELVIAKGKIKKLEQEVVNLKEGMSQFGKRLQALENKNGGDYLPQARVHSIEPTSSPSVAGLSLGPLGNFPANLSSYESSPANSSFHDTDAVAENEDNLERSLSIGMQWSEDYSNGRAVGISSYDNDLVVNSSSIAPIASGGGRSNLSSSQVSAISSIIKSASSNRDANTPPPLYGDNGLVGKMVQPPSVYGAPLGLKSPTRKQMQKITE